MYLFHNFMKIHQWLFESSFHKHTNKQTNRQTAVKRRSYLQPPVAAVANEKELRQFLNGNLP